MFDFAQLNWLAIAAASAAGFLIGGPWYGPLFGKAWLKAVGKSPDELDGAGRAMAVSLAAQIVAAIAMALIFNALGGSDVLQGVQLGLLVGIGLIASAMASDYAFCGWGRALFWIQSGYRIVYSVAMGAILGAFA